MRQQYHLGQLFRQRYSTELNARYLFDNYTRTQVHVRSTDHDRTLNSAQCQLASFFKPNEAQVRKEDERRVERERRNEGRGGLGRVEGWGGI